MTFLLLQGGCIEGLPFIPFEQIQSALIFILQPARLRQQISHLLPDEIIKALRTHLFVVTNSFAAETISVRADTAIIGILPSPLGSRLADLLAVIGITAMTADGQALEEEGSTPAALTGLFAVFIQLLLNGEKEILADNGRDWDLDPLTPVGSYRRIPFLAYFSAMAGCANTWQRSPGLGLAESSAAHMSRDRLRQVIRATAATGAQAWRERPFNEVMLDP